MREFMELFSCFLIYMCKGDFFQIPFCWEYSLSETCSVQYVILCSFEVVLVDVLQRDQMASWNESKHWMEILFANTFVVPVLKKTKYNWEA